MGRGEIIDKIMEFFFKGKAAIVSILLSSLLILLFWAKRGMKTYIQAFAQILKI